LREALILAGGLGSRLRPANEQDLPKALVHVGGSPFIDTLLWNLSRHGIEKFIFSLGHRAEQLTTHLDSLPKNLGAFEYRIEPEPLGTGGAIAFAGEKIAGESFLLVNGDTLFDFNYLDLASLRDSHDAAVAIALKRVADAGRYGSVTVDGDAVVSFDEKLAGKEGLIAGGVSAIATRVLSTLPSGPFSFERDTLPLLVSQSDVVGRPYDGFFIDIGTPESLDKGFSELPQWRSKPAVFLDRDGVLNVDHGHVHTAAQFEWMPGAPEAVKWLNDRGFLVFVVTNQAGIAKGYYTEQQYLEFEKWISRQLAKFGAHIDQTYYCPHHPDGVGQYAFACDCRKPEPQMLLNAMAEWKLDPRRTVLLGDKQTDIQAARRAGIKSILCGSGVKLSDAVQQAVQLA
jgi:D-glycero-D-manno-heptose 1,7-bisphosphate phosphatase